MENLNINSIIFEEISEFNKTNFEEVPDEVFNEFKLGKYTDNDNRKHIKLFTAKDGNKYIIKKRINHDIFEVFNLNDVFDFLNKKNNDKTINYRYSNPPIATAVFDVNYLKNYITGYVSSESINVSEKYRRLGIATAMTDFAEQFYKMPYRPTDVLSQEMQGFVKNRFQKENTTNESEYNTLADFGNRLPAEVYDNNPNIHNNDNISDVKNNDVNNIDYIMSNSDINDNILNEIEENLRELLNENNDLNNLIAESFDISDLTDDEIKKIYNIFKQSYEKATGTSWDYYKFKSRAYDWKFYGDENGFVTVRPQRSGYYKLTGVAGNIKSIMNGLNELNNDNIPVWGMATKEITDVLVKRFGYRIPTKVESLILSKLIPAEVFGNVEYKRNPNGSITFNYPDVGEATKFFVGNKQYFDNIRKDLLKNASFKNLYNLYKKKVNEINLNEEIINLSEKRAVKDYSEDSFMEIRKYINNNFENDIYISFRSSLHTGLINRKNIFDTPTGLYCYPLVNYYEKVDASGNIEEFNSSFPYLGEQPPQYVFLFTVDKSENILYSDDDRHNTAKIDKFVDEIEKNYGQPNDITNPISRLCDAFRNNTFTSSVNNSNQYNSDFQKLWLFIYEVALKLKNKTQVEYGNVVNTFTLICNKINLYGFVDDRCTGTIHPNEPCQAVFFNKIRNIAKNPKLINIQNEYTDKELRFDVVNRYTHGKALTKSELNRRDVNTIHNYVDFVKKYNGYDKFYIFDDRFKFKIKNNIPYMASIDDGMSYMFVNKYGKPDLNNLNLNYLNPNELTIAINQEPKIIENLDEKSLDKLTSTNLESILIQHPETIDYFKNYLSELKDMNISYIIITHPSLIDYFENRIDNMDSSYFSKMLISHPTLVLKFKEKFNKLSNLYLLRVLSSHIGLLRFADEVNLNNLDDIDIKDLIVKYPEILINKNLKNKYFRNRLNHMNYYTLRNLLYNKPNLIYLVDDERLRSFTKTELNNLTDKPEVYNHLKKLGLLSDNNDGENNQ